jgi:hypothetical protein
VKKRPTAPPLTKTERAALDGLIRRGAAALNPVEGSRLLRLLELDQADRQQERRTAGAMDTTNRALRQQLKDAEARLAAVRALHYPESSWHGGLQCYLCRDDYPCLTVQAVDGQEARR